MPATDLFTQFTSGLQGPAEAGAAISPNDTQDLPYLTRAIYVGGDGDIRLTLQDGSEITFSAAVAGTVLPLRASRIWQSGTSATNLVALW